MNQFFPLAAIFVLTLGALVYLVAGNLLERFGSAGWFAAVTIVGSIVGLSYAAGGDQGLVRGILVDDYSQALSFVACFGALVSILATESSVRAEKIEMLSEYYFLLLMSLCGALIMICASDFLTLFVGLEVASLSLYCLCGARVTKTASGESALKYFLLGCFSSAFFLYGVALWYGATGSLAIHAAAAPVSGMTSIMMLSFVLLVIGFAFKIGIAPFHFWVPDVYQGAPTSVTTFMSCVIKVAALAALIKVSVVSFGLPSEWALGVLWVLSALAMTVGNLAALQQRSVKRMLAYSSVAHAGYMLMGLVALSGGGGAIVAAMFYLVAYSAMTIGAFAVVSAMGPDVDDISDFKGLARRSPFLATCMTLFCLALAGLPPGMAGLMGKVYLFTASVSANCVGLAIIAALNSALACVYYFRVPMAMLFQSGERDEKLSLPILARASIALCAAAVVILGVLPERFVLTRLAEAANVLHRAEGPSPLGK